MSFLSLDYRRTTIRKPPELYTGLDARLFSLVSSMQVGPGMVGLFLEQARQIEERAGAWKDLAENRLQHRLQEFREAFRRRRRGWEALLPDALAAVREAAGRHLGLRPYEVQLAGALALQRGYLRQAFVDDLFHRHETEHATYYGDMLWTLLTLELWFRQFVDHSRSAAA